MTIEEAIRRLENISSHAVHTIEEESFIMSLDDGIAIKMAIKSFETLRDITVLFDQWTSGELNDGQYHFQMQNLILFGKKLAEVENESTDNG